MAAVSDGAGQMLRLDPVPSVLVGYLTPPQLVYLHTAGFTATPIATELDRRAAALVAERRDDLMLIGTPKRPLHANPQWSLLLYHTSWLHTCSGSGAPAPRCLPPDEVWACAVDRCKRHLCEECGSSCRTCHDSVCHRHCRTCDQCNESVCQACHNEPCFYCKRSFCRDCDKIANHECRMYDSDYDNPDDEDMPMPDAYDDGDDLY
jgi:hypothetical protein